MAPIRVLYVINGLGTGGAERSLAESLPLLDGHGIDPTVVCLFKRAEGVQDSLIRTGFDSRFVGGRSLVSRTRSVRATIRELCPDVVHTAIFEADQIGRIASVRRVVVVTSLVSTPYDPKRVREDPNVSKLKLNAVQVIDGLTSRSLTAHFHAVSETVKRAAIAALHIPEERITVIHRGRDPKRLGEPSLGRRYRARRQLGLNPSQPVLANVGRQEYVKGQRYLIRATADLRRTHPDIVTLIAGRSGNATEELRTTVKSEGLESNVMFLGHTEMIGDVLAAADVFVLPSIYEGLPGAIIEAMALGLPVVASGIPQVRELVEENRSALLVPVGSSSDIAAAVRRLLADDSLRREFGHINRQEFLSHFTIDRYVDQLANLYRSVVETP